MKTISIGAMAMGSVVTFCALGLIAFACLDRDIYTATVVSKRSVVPETGKPYYLIRTTLADGRARTFKYKYYFADSELDVPDLAAMLEEGKTYRLDTRGLRIPRTSVYEAITAVEEVPSR
jgi:hypothetical protein